MTASWLALGLRGRLNCSSAFSSDETYNRSRIIVFIHNAISFIHSFIHSLVRSLIDFKHACIRCELDLQQPALARHFHEGLIGRRSAADADLLLKFQSSDSDRCMKQEHSQAP